MLVLMIIFVVLMVLWIALGIYSVEPGPSRRAQIGGNLIPWLCVAILGWVIFNGVPVAAVR